MFVNSEHFLVYSFPCGFFSLADSVPCGTFLDPTTHILQIVSISWPTGLPHCFCFSQLFPHPSTKLFATYELYLADIVPAGRFVPAQKRSCSFVILHNTKFLN